MPNKELKRHPMKGSFKASCFQRNPEPSPDKVSDVSG